MEQKLRLLYYNSFFRYLVVGSTTFAIDLGLLFMLHGALKTNLIIAATVSYWVSITYNFTLNRFWTFGVKDQENLKRHLLLYLGLLAFNYLFTILFLHLTTAHGVNFAIAKVIAVAIQMTWSYIVYHKYIFIQPVHNADKTQ